MGFERVIECGANLATIGALIFVGCEIRLMKKEQNIQHEKQERLKAIELAEFYKENLINDISYLSKIYKEIGVEEEIKSIKYHELKNFDKAELEDIFKSDDKIKQIHGKIINVDVEILRKNSLYLENDINKEEVDKYTDAEIASKIMKDVYKHVSEAKNEIAATSYKCQENNELKNNRILKELDQEILKLKKLDDSYNTYYTMRYSKVLTRTLNSLESFCMYFNSGIADEETIYQSLHQSFLSMVKVLYILIAYQNNQGKDKYFTNIIELYNKWSERYSEKETNEKENMRKNIHKKKKIQR